ncbi:MAG: pyruvate formate lyase family protein, partial [Promethearchaeota archaeon]
MQLEQSYPNAYDYRITKMKNKVITVPHELCIERAKLFTESYKKTKGEPSVIRFAKALNYFLSNMTIKIWDDEFIVGNRCTKFVGTPLYPEVRVDTIELDLDLYSTRDVQKFLISDIDKEFLKNEIIPYWKIEEDTVKSRFDSYLSPDLFDLMLMMIYIVDVNITNGVGHFFPGHE